MSFNYPVSRPGPNSAWLAAGCNAAGRPRPSGLYSPCHEHDSCGVGLLVSLDPTPRHELIQKSLQILVNLEHRGAIGGDRTTGDGAGLLLEMPDQFLRSQMEKRGIGLPRLGEYGAGMLMLPSQTAKSKPCQELVEQVVSEQGCNLLGWRPVPIDSSNLGELALRTLPRFRQVIIGQGKVLDNQQFERKLYLIRRIIENRIASRQDDDFSQFYIVSLSSRTMIYKGMLTGSQISSFFPDLQDRQFAGSFSIVHQRYSTNTLPAWSLAQPFRMIAHNGEINTLRGNVNRMRAREAILASPWFDGQLDQLKPIINESGSDSAIFDNVLELLVQGGRQLPHAAMMMIPEAWGSKYYMSADKRAFYEYHCTIMEPWDGPAALAFTDGRYIGATLDRNGLRPARHCTTSDGLLVMASESGVLDLPAASIRSLGRLQPGKMLLIDLLERRLVPDHEIKSRTARRQPYRHWLADHAIELRGLLSPAEIPPLPKDELLVRQHLFGYTREELRMILNPMAANGQEPIGSMGDDLPLAVLSQRPQLLYGYFKQLFAQVTNPPIDPLREELVMSLMSYTGREHNLLEESPAHCRQLKLNHPILTPEDVERLLKANHPDLRTRQLDALFPADSGGEGLGQSLDKLFTAAEAAVRDGATLLVLSDRRADSEQVPIPMLLAAAGLHHHLIRKGLRTMAGIIVESDEVREVFHFAMLIGYGVNGICPRLAFSIVRQMSEDKLLDRELTASAATDNYIAAIKKGLLKTFSRMGISTLRSFRGAQIFEAIGLNTPVIDRYFTSTSSRIGGIGLREIAGEAQLRHQAGYPKSGSPSPILEAGGRFSLRQSGEKHLWTAQAICSLQRAVRENKFEFYQDYAAAINQQSQQAITLRSLLELIPGTPVRLDQVEPVETIVRRFVCSAMSFGSISREAHETIATGVNRIGARSNSGEGGEDPARFTISANGEKRSSLIKQVASGRFGVTTDYLLHANEIQIKVAQGAKPGEGGQLPGHKVSAEIAAVRHTTPGVTLISPPPHHDIYSIEDLAQLIYDLKCVNPKARVSVKLVSEVGVGTIAAGVAKAQADMVQIAGGDGGTGASPLTAIKYAGMPWELGLAETQQTLQHNGLRDTIRIQVDGQLRTGRDLAVAALLGAEEFGFATVVLVAIGCIMMRKCHNNTCPVGVATQDPALRKLFTGKPEHVERLFRFMAEDLRRTMAELGFRTIDEMVGQRRQLNPRPALAHWKSKGLDLSRLLLPEPKLEAYPKRCLRRQFSTPVSCFDDQLIKLSRVALEQRQKVRIEQPVRNVDRTIGGRLSGQVIARHGPRGLPEETIFLSLKGSAGQSLGSFLAPGITIRLQGDVNDYLGKSMSGGRIIVTPPARSRLTAHENVICGNVVCYGAVAGEVYLNGIAGERFCVRNSGAVAVVEGVGDHGCEYMTGGRVVVLGSTGNNFAAGMSGGIAYVHDETELFDTRCNLDMVDIESVYRPEDVTELRSLLEKHLRYTGSERARMILRHWQKQLAFFVKVMPIDYRRALARMKQETRTEDETVSATEEVYDG